MKLVRRIASVLCYVGSGVLVATALAVTFLDVGAMVPGRNVPYWFKPMLAGTYLVLSAIAFLLGHFTAPSRNWLRDSGIILVTSAGMISFTGLSFFCIVVSGAADAYKAGVNWKVLGGDYPTGVVCIIVSGLLGVMMIRAGLSRKDADCSKASVDQATIRF